MPTHWTYTEVSPDADLLQGDIQNEQSLGLFYLHEDADAGIAVPSVALLRVGVTLRVQHYNVLVRSRRGRLDPEFTAKLGWLVGNLYSRIGTPDWSEPKERRRQLRSLVQDTLDADDSDLIQRATELFRELVPEVTDDQLKKVGNRLNNDPIFAQAMKSAKTE